MSLGGVDTMDVVIVVGLIANFVGIMSYPLRIEHRLTKTETLLQTIQARVKLISKHIFETRPN